MSTYTDKQYSKTTEYGKKSAPKDRFSIKHIKEVIKVTPRVKTFVSNSFAHPVESLLKGFDKKEPSSYYYWSNSYNCTNYWTMYRVMALSGGIQWTRTVEL